MQGFLIAAGGPRLLLVDLTNQFFQLWFVLYVARSARPLVVNHPRRFGLAHALAGVGLYRLGGGEPGWLAFRHGKIKYGIGTAGTEAGAPKILAAQCPYRAGSGAANDG